MSIPPPPFAVDAQPMLQATVPNSRAIGALWSRIIAFVIDGILIGLLGTALAIPFFSILSRLGAWGLLVGFCIALPYFATLNSSIGNGQTLGKRWMRLQVVDAGGNTISIGKSLLRSTVFAIPYYLNGIPLPITRTPAVITTIIGLTVVVVGGATLYMVLFSRHTRQGLHDSAAGSYVGVAGQTGPLRILPIWKVHWLILGSLLVIFGVASQILLKKLTTWGPFPQLLDDVRLVEGVNGVQRAGAQDLRSGFGGTEKKTTLVISVFWSGNSGEEEAFADRIGKMILQQDLTARVRDSIRVVVVRGYDIGIAHARVTHAFEHTPAEWSAR